jgi:hypothetical protein
MAGAITSVAIRAESFLWLYVDLPTAVDLLYDCVWSLAMTLTGVLKRTTTITGQEETETRPAHHCISQCETTEVSSCDITP